MRRGRLVVQSAVLACGLVTALAVAQPDEIHRNAFSGKTTQLVKGTANVPVEVKAHEQSAERSRSLPTSERIRLTLGAGKYESNSAYYYYPTPVAPITEDLTAELWVHSNRVGVQFLARVVFPKIRNPKQLDESLTRIVLLDTVKAPAGGWQRLMLRRPEELLQAQKQALRLDLKGDPDVSGAYIDRLILNLYTGPGDVEVYVDNLEIGPVIPGAAPPPSVAPKGPPGKDKATARTDRGIPVAYNRGRLSVGGAQVFPRFVKYSGTPLQALKEAGFNALYMPAEIAPEILEDAIDNYQFWIVPNIPPVSEANSERAVSPLTARDADALAASIRKFQSGDAVLFWDLGAVRSEDYRRVSRTVEAIRAADPRRPAGADVWDGFRRFALPLELVGTHRDPLLTTLELDQYRLWLAQRRALATGARFQWTWVQTHIPDWQIRLLYDQPTAEDCPDPIGPQPEQIRLLTYLALAAGHKGLGFWSDRFLADSHQGRARMLQLALLNQEMEMLEPLLMNLSDTEIQWVPSSHPAVQVAVLRTTQKGVLALPIWLGHGAQYVPPFGATFGLTFTVPLVPDGAEPWEVTPARVQSLQNQLRERADGIQITLPEFDLTAAVVFSSDFACNGLLAMWQKHVKRVGRFAAAWAIELAEEQYRHVVRTHQKLAECAPPLEGVDAGELIKEARCSIQDAKRARAGNNEEGAYFHALRALRPLRHLMRAHWERAVRSLDYPAATPYSVSYHTLPRHWELAGTLRASRLGADVLPDGDFEAARAADRRGVPVTDLPGWTVQEVALDDVVMSARIVPGEEAVEQVAFKVAGPRQIYVPTSQGKRIEEPEPPRPELGSGVLRLAIGPRPVTLKKGEKAPPEPRALERVFLGVNSPPVRLPPGTWVRISGWAKLPAAVRATADGAMLFDSVAGEGYAVRLTEKLDWRQFHFYRKVPESGEIRVRLALTGFGTAYFDDIRVEPFAGSAERPGRPEFLPPAR